MAKRIIEDISGNPYYDKYDSKKQYTQLLAIPGRVAQARELTELQSTLKDIIRSIGNSVLKDGDIIEGCQVTIKTENNNLVAKVSPGRIYISGMVLPVEDSSDPVNNPSKTVTIPITGVGTETIGAKLVQYLITEAEDNTLRDPAQGYDNFNQPGCHRLQSTVSIVLNDSKAATISTIQDGEVYLETYAPDYDTLAQTLARRTYDESGSYVVNGLNARVESSEETSKYTVVIESGKAYVLGYELGIPNARRVKANRSTTYVGDTMATTYYTTEDTYDIFTGHPFVKEILKVTGAKKIQENLSNTSGGNKLSHDNVIIDSNYIRVWNGATEYTYGTDYTVVKQGDYYVNWKSGGSSPADSYNIEYRYNKEFSAATDYSLIIKSDGSHAIKWTSGGDHPENNVSMEVEFNQYLARKDVVYLDMYGAIAILEGVPATYNNEVAPETPLNTLVLAIIDNPPNGSAVATSSSEAVQVNNIGLTRFTMQDIQSLLNRVKTVEYDQAVLSLNDEAKNDTTSNKKGIFTDPLIDLSHIDFYFDKNGISYDMALDLVSNICYLPVDTHTNAMTYNSSSSTTKKYGRLLTLPTSGNPTSVLSQSNATKLFQINPYSVYPQLPIVTIDPAVDSWIKDTVIQVPVSIQNSEVVSMSTRTIDNRTQSRINNSNYSTKSTTSTADTAIGTKTTSYSTEDIVSETAVTYIRQRTLTVEGFNFYPGLDNIFAYFDGVLVSLTPATGTSAGSTTIGETTSVKADDKGYVKATFTIPANILTGTREVILKSNDTAVSGYTNEGFTFYTAQGLNRVIHNTVTTVTTVLLERVTTTTLSSVYVDPIGQTFVLDHMTLVSGIDLYFGNKPADATKIPVVCEIRGVSNGTITSKIYAQASLYPSEVSVSNNSSVKTSFTFSDPVLLEENTEYAFVVRSTSDLYTLWVAELGGTDVLTNNVVLKNPYMTGVMMSSSNNATWTAHQTTDIKFNITADNYGSSAYAIFDEITVSEFSRIYLSADAATPQGTSVAWYYKLNGESDYMPINPYNIANTNRLAAANRLKTGISLKVELTKTDANSLLSPMVALDTIALTTSCYDISNSNGYYISKKIGGTLPLSNFTNVKIIMDVYEPTAGSTSIEAKVSIDDTNLVNTTRSNSYTQLANGWKECTYTATVASSTACRIFIKATSSHKYETPAFRRLRVIFS